MASRDFMSMLDRLENSARAQVAAGGTTDKVASAPDLVKEATQLADALEVAAMEGLGVRSPISEILKAGAAQGAPAQTITNVTGQQGLPPTHGRTKVPKPAMQNGHPTQTTTDLTGDPTNAAKQGTGEPESLYDILTKNLAPPKQAGSGAGSPEEADAGSTFVHPPTANEGVLQRLFSSNEATANVTKREAKLPTRGRLAELFNSASDTLSQETVAQIFPRAAASGGLKVAGVGAVHAMLGTGLAAGGALGLKAYLERRKRTKGDDDTKSASGLPTIASLFAQTSG